LKVRHRKIAVTVACAGGRCAGTLTLSAVEHLSGHRITAVSAAKRQTRNVTLGRTTYTVAAGTSAAFTMTLNRTARRLLKTRHHFRAALALTPAGSPRAAASRTVTLAR
jgi:hypothetical protein